MKIRSYLIFVCVLALAGPAAWPQAALAGMKEGQKTYERFCAICHGKNGKAVFAGAPDFSSRLSLRMSERELREHIKNGKRACPAHKGILKENDISDLIIYLSVFF